MKGQAETDERGKLAGMIGALEESLRKTRRYQRGSAAFYLVLIAAFSVLVAVTEDPKGRGADIGILILVSLGFLGMWISPLRGLRGNGFTVAGFFNLFRLPLAGRLEELKDDAAWSGENERLDRARELLERQAEAEKEMRAWPNRLLSLVVITVIDLLIWLVWDNWLMALVNQGIAMVVSQVHITWAPTPSLEAWKEMEGE